MKYLLQAIEAKRDVVRLSDAELRKLLVEVRSGKDDRIEFTESMTRLLEELRSNEHATAFLTKVAKREAPDYYDVIKNPMDLGTMLRNVKNARYKNKAQFMRDLDLIWDNCLTYNSEPTHVLRRSVQILRAKADHLLTYVNDTNDVKEALNQWQPSSGTTTDRVSGTPLGSGMFSPLAIGMNGLRKGSLFMNGRSLSMGLKQVNASLSDTPFEQQPALQRSTDGMSTYLTLDEGLSRADERFARLYLHTEERSEEPGPSRWPLQSFQIDSPAPNGITANSLGDILRTLDSGSASGCFHSALTIGPKNDNEDSEEDSDRHTGRDGNRPNGHATDGRMHRKRRRKQRDGSIPYPFHLPESTEGATSEGYQLGAWWNAIDRSALLVNGITPLASSAQVEPGPSRTIGYRARRKKRRKDSTREERDLFGGIKALEDNVKTITRLRKIHAKYGALMGHLEHEEPIPAALAVVSSDESEEEATEVKEGEGKKSRLRHRDVDMPPTYIPDPQRDPLPKLSSEGAIDILECKTQLLLAHAGFEGVQKGAASVLADVAAAYIMNIGRTFRMYLDQFAREMSVEEIILHGLYENGGMDVRSLESYLVENVIRYGSKMTDLLQRLQSSYRDTLNNANYTMEDEVYFAENGEGNNDQIMSGTFAQEIGDDFFGFKEMGLDQELGLDMSRLVVPSKLFNRGVNVGIKGRGAVPVGVNGIPRSHVAAEVVAFEPPPPYVPISESTIPAQIGLLQSFYRDQLRSKGQWQDKSVSEEDIEIAAANEDGDYDDPPRPQQKKKTKKRIFVLPDEEMERQRYKVPPNGKMPKRAFQEKENASKYDSVSAAAAPLPSQQVKSTTPAGTKKKKK